MKIILLNAPARSAKDTIADYLELSIGATHLKFATPLYNSIPHLFGICDAEWERLYQEEKETPQPKLQGMTCREAMIWVSEDVLKPKFGQSYMGILAARAIIDLLPAKGTSDRVFVYSDAGFSREASVLVDVFGNKDIHLVRLERPEHTFVGDSRSYYSPEEAGIAEQNFHVLVNDGTLDEMYGKVDDLISLIMGEE